MNSKRISRRRRWLRPVEGEGAAIVGITIAVALLAASLRGLENFRSDQLQQKRTAEQAQLVEAMESLHNTAVSELVTDWLLTYPPPSEQRLAELRDLANQVQADPAPLLGSSIEAARTGGPVPARSDALAARGAAPAFVRIRASH